MQATFTIPIQIAAPVQVATVSLPGGYIGQSYSAQCVATGGFGPFSWSATGLPAGLNISSGGLISGTPTGPSGTATVTLTVADSNG